MRRWGDLVHRPRAGPSRCGSWRWASCSNGSCSCRARSAARCRACSCSARFVSMRWAASVLGSPTRSSSQCGACEECLRMLLVANGGRGLGVAVVMARASARVGWRLQLADSSLRTFSITASFGLQCLDCGLHVRPVPSGSQVRARHPYRQSKRPGTGSRCRECPPAAPRSSRRWRCRRGSTHRPVVGEHASNRGVDLGEPDRLTASVVLDGKIETPVSREQRADPRTANRGRGNVAHEGSGRSAKPRHQTPSGTLRQGEHLPGARPTTSRLTSHALTLGCAVSPSSRTPRSSRADASIRARFRPPSERSHVFQERSAASI